MIGGNDEFRLTQTEAGPAGLLRSGDRLAGRYEIDRLLGGGGMGLVYAARDEQLGETVALKVLRDGAVDAAAAARFREEIRLSRRVSHPGVVRIHDLGQDGNVTFLTMDLVPGETLRDRLAEGPLTDADGISIARQLAAALHAAHEQGIVHRDVKPSNVLVDWDEDGAAPKAWLTDFGIARAVGGAQLTAADAVPGTPAYLSPEQVRGEDVTPATDIYALGLLFCEMLTGRVPVSGETMGETLGRRGSGRTPMLRAMQDADPALREIVARCVAPRPQDRYESASAVADALETLRPGRRRPDWKVIAMAGAASLAFVVVGATFLLPSPSGNSELEPVAASATVAAPSIAVLPIANQTGDSSYDWVRAGLPDSIAQRFADSGVPVTDPGRVRETLAALRLDADSLPAERRSEVAALLDADRLLTAQLVGGEAGRRLEATVLQGDDRQRVGVDVRDGDVLAAADALVRILLSSSGVPDGPLPEPLSLTADEDALAAYDRGLTLAARGEAGAADAFAEAVAADDSFAAGWDALAGALAEEGRIGDAVAAAQRAVEASEEGGGRPALGAKARLAAMSGNTEDAVRLLRQLVERYPNDLEARVRLADALGALGANEAAREQLSVVVEAAPNHPRAWYFLGKFAILGGDAKRAIDDYLLRALTVQNRLGSAAGQSEVFNALGIAHERLGEAAEARQYYVNAAEAARRGGDDRALGTALTNAARLAVYAGDLTAAQANLEQARGLFEQMGDDPSLADVEVELGIVAEAAGDFERALEHYREAARLHAAYGDTQSIISDRTNLAFAYAMTGRYDEARVYADSALQAAEGSDNAPAIMRAQQVAGEVALARGDWDRSLAAYLEALRIARAVGDPYGEAVAEAGIGRVAFEQGRSAAALDAWSKAEGLIAPLGDARGQLEFALLRAELLTSEARTDDARAVLEEAREFEDAASAQQRARLAKVAAQLSGDETEAEALLAKSRDAAERSGDPATKLAVEIASAEVLSPNDADRAAALLSDATRLGHTPLILEASVLASRAALASGDAASAAKIAGAAQRPPFGRRVWRGVDDLRAVLERAGVSDEVARAEAP